MDNRHSCCFGKAFQILCACDWHVADFSEAKSTISFCVLLIAELAIDSVVYWIGLLLFAVRSTQTERKSSLRFEV